MVAGRVLDEHFESIQDAALNILAILEKICVVQCKRSISWRIDVCSRHGQADGCKAWKIRCFGDLPRYPI